MTGHMSFKSKFQSFNRGVAWVLVRILSPILLTLLWITIGLSALLPRLFGVEFLLPFCPGEESHWAEHDPVDTSLRGLGCQG